MASKGGLNPAAKEFTPASYSSTVSWPEDLFDEDHITPEELDELEMAEAWVNQLVKLEEEEEEHLVAVALRYAPQAKVAEIQRRCGLKGGAHKMRAHHKGIHSAHGAAGVQHAM